MAQHNILGKKGEDMAAQFLQKKGYKILVRNYRYQKGEVDIIAKKDDLLLAVEVKTRSTPEFGNPQDFVKPKQIQQLVKVVDYYIQDQGLEVEVRFDIVAIIKNNVGTRIEHLEDAFFYF